jgi:hypothetical protein
MSRRNPFVLILAAACVALDATGCAVIGFTLGVVEERASNNYDTLHVGQVGELEEGDSVSVTCDSNAFVAGEYIGLDHKPTEEYRATFAAWQMNDSAGLLLPSLGDTVVVQRTSPLRANVVGPLLGFDPGVICVRVGSDIDMVRVGDVRKVAGGPERVITGESLRNLLDRGRIPFMSTLLVGIGAKTFRIALYEVSEIQKSNPKGQSWKGLLIGAAADILILAGLSSTMSGGFMGGK